MKNNLRNIINVEKKQIYLPNFVGSEQNQDLSEVPNCQGYGRIHHFQSSTIDGWVSNPLPIYPAQKKMNLPFTDKLDAQIFQITSCNVNCCYCFVPQSMKRGVSTDGKWFYIEELIDLFMEEKKRPNTIVVSGGNPELTPEIIVWIMKELDKRGISKNFYIWSDDALSGHYWGEYLTLQEIQYIQNYRNYGKVCCFKGFDDESIKYSAKSDISLDKQLEIFEMYMKLGIDLYGYVTFVTPNLNNIRKRIETFIIKLQRLNFYLPLRMVPLPIEIFPSMEYKIPINIRESINNQFIVLEEWLNVLSRYYSSNEMHRPITDIDILV